MFTASICWRSEILSLSSSLISTNCPEVTFSTNFCGKGSVAGERLTARAAAEVWTGWEAVRRGGATGRGVSPGCEGTVSRGVDHATDVAPRELLIRGTEARAGNGGRVPSGTGMVPKPE
jgi:hypothetical protein